MAVAHRCVPYKHRRFYWGMDLTEHSHWLDGPQSPRCGGKTPKLTDYELEATARACRTYHEREAAKKIDNLAIRAGIGKRVESAVVLAEPSEQILGNTTTCISHRKANS